MVVLTRRQRLLIDDKVTCSKINCHDRISCEGDDLCLMHKIKFLKCQFSKFKIRCVILKKRTKNPKYTFKSCIVDSCNNLPFVKGKCARHSGMLKCNMEGCKKMRQKGGYCVEHGGTYTKAAKCKYEDCVKFNQGGGYCRTHGGGKRCKYSLDCRGIVMKDIGFCKKHVQNVPSRVLIEKIN